MHKYVDTSNLVTYRSGKYKGKYDWINNIGKQVYFEYEDLSGYIKIIDYRKDIPQGWITLKYKENIITTTTPNFLHLKAPSLIGKEKQSNKYKYKVGQIIHKYQDALQILEQIRIEYHNSSCRGYKIKCLDCEFEYETREEILSTCPICGKRSSYSERFIYSMFIQANIKFIPQQEFEWLPKRYYDIYLPDYNAVIEINGEQHYSPVKLNNDETPEETYANTLKSDQIKYDKAVDNNILYYEIDTRNQDNIYEKVISVLNFIDFTSVSKLQCEKFANYKYIINECNLWNKGLTLDEISQKTNKSIQTIQAKLRLGNKYGMCIYDKHTNMSNHMVINPNK